MARWAVSCAMRSHKMGRRFEASIQVTITTAGTATGAVNVAMPFTAETFAYWFGTETVSGAPVIGAWTGTNLVVRRIDGAALIANGNIIDLSGFGESQ